MIKFADAKDFIKDGCPVLTVRQPYALFLVNGAKEYEFRSKDLPRKYINQWILIGKQIKKEIVYFNKESYDYYVSMVNKAEMYSCIIGAVKFCDSVPNGGNGSPVVIGINYKFAWRMLDAVRFKEPVMNVKGHLGIWKFKVNNKNR